MKTVQHNGSTYDVNEEGYLVDFPEELDENWIDYARACEGIGELNSDQKEVVNKLWGYYKENRIIPKLGVISRITGYSLKRIFEMFPSGPSGAGRMVGFQRKFC